MSIIKLSPALPKGINENALVAMDAAQLADHPRDLFVVARLRPKAAKQMLAGFEGDDYVELAFLGLEVLSGPMAETAQELMMRARTQRTGEVSLFSQPAVGPFTVPCERCDGTGEITAMDAVEDDDEWAQGCRACGGTGEVELPVEEVGRAVVWLVALSFGIVLERDPEQQELDVAEVA